MNNTMEKEIFEIYIDDIIPNRFQPRLTFDEKALNELADSIRQHGIIQPLVVRKVSDKYEIIAGERRYKAAQMVGLEKVPAVVMNLDDKASAEVAVIENIQRKDLTALEEAESYKKLLDKGYLTQDQLATRMGKTQATISNKLRLLGLPDEVKEAVLNNKISERHARSLLSLKDSNTQKEVLDKIINNRLTVKQTDDLIKAMTGVNVENNESADNNNMTFPQPIPVPIPSFSNFSIPEPPIKTPTVENVEQIVKPEEEKPTPFVNDIPDLNPIPTIDINQMKEGAVDINSITPPADLNALLGINITPPQIEKEEPEVHQPRFIPSMEDEEANMEVQEPEIEVNQNPDQPATIAQESEIEEPVKPEIETPPVPFTQQENVTEEVPINNDNVAPINVEPSIEPVNNELIEQVPIPNIISQTFDNVSPEPVNVPETPMPEANVSEATMPEVTIPETNIPEIANPVEAPIADNMAQETQQENVQINDTTNVTSSDLRNAINIIRENVRNLENNNFKIDIEEFDFENLYQIIIKINK